MATSMSQACERCWKRKQKCARDFPCLQCRVASKTCMRRRQGSIVNPSDTGGESYVESLKARIASMKTRINESGEPPGNSPEVPSPNASITTPAQRQTPQELQNDMRNAMQEASYLSLSAMAERTDKHRSVAEGLSFRSLLNAAVKAGPRNTVALDGHSDHETNSLTRIDDFICNGNTSAPFQAYTKHVGSSCPYIELARLEIAYRHVTGEYSRGTVSAKSSTSPELYVLVYLGLATGISLSSGYERHQQITEDLVRRSLEAFSYVMDIGDDLATVHCLIALTVCSLYLDKAGSTWHLLGLAMTRGVACGLHTAKISQPDSQVNLTEHARAFWALFLLDTRVSSALDQPFYLEETAAMKPEDLSSEEIWRYLLTQARIVRNNRQYDGKEALPAVINLQYLHETMASRCVITKTDSVEAQAFALVEYFKYSVVTRNDTSKMVVSVTADVFNDFLVVFEDQLISRTEAPTSLDGLLVFAIGTIMCHLHAMRQIAKQQTAYQAINILTLLSTRYRNARGLRDILMELVMASVSAEVQQPSARLHELIEKLGIQLPRRLEMMILR